MSNAPILNEDQRFMINVYISQYTQANTQMTNLYQHMADIRRNINTIYTQANTNSTQGVYDFYIPVSNPEPSPVRPTNSQIIRATRNCLYSDIHNPLNEECPILLEMFLPTSQVTQIRQCRHVFNSTELFNWFITNSRCPVCRFDIRHYGLSNNTNNNTVVDISNNIIYNPSSDESNIIHYNNLNQLINDLSNNVITNDDLVNLYHSLMDNNNM